MFCRKCAEKKTHGMVLCDMPTAMPTYHIERNKIFHFCDFIRLNPKNPCSSDQGFFIHYESDGISSTRLRVVYHQPCFAYSFGTHKTKAPYQGCFLFCKVVSVNRTGTAARQEYFDSDESRIAYCTKYAGSRGVQVGHTGGNDVNDCCWWLRSPGHKETYAVNVHYYGITDSSTAVDYTQNGVRPVIRIQIIDLYNPSF